MNGRVPGRGTFHPVAVVALAAFVAIVLFPYYWMVATSLRGAERIPSGPAALWPAPVTLAHYREVLQGDFPIWVRNTALVAVVSSGVGLLCSVPAAYAFTRLRLPARGAMGSLVLLAYLLPPTALFIPLSTLVRALGLSNTLTALMVVYPAFTVPFSTWFLMGFFKSVPMELEEAALVDGASRGQAFWHIALPLTLPGVLAVGMFSFTLSWNEFLYALVFISSSSLYPLSVGITQFITGDVYRWGKIMAMSVMMVLPVLALYVYLQRYMEGGLTAGSLKGQGARGCGGGRGGRRAPGRHAARLIATYHESPRGRTQEESNLEQRQGGCQAP